MTKLLIIRHATNDALKEHVLVGRLPGVHLNEEGRAQARALAERLANVDLAAIYTSPLERTQETAQPLATRHGLELRVHAGLNETDCGRWAGQSLERLHRRRLSRALGAYPSGTRFPGGESAWEVQVRMVAALEEIGSAHSGQTVAVVSHADPIRIVLAYYIGLPVDLFRRLVVAPASINVLALDGLVPRLLCLNDTSHLAEPEGWKGA